MNKPWALPAGANKRTLKTEQASIKLNKSFVCASENVGLRMSLTLIYPFSIFVDLGVPQKIHSYHDRIFKCNNYFSTHHQVKTISNYSCDRFIT